MKIATVRITPIAFRDPPLLNASGVHEPYALRTIIEVESDNGLVGLGETYGDRATLEPLQRLARQLAGLSPFDLNGLEALVKADALQHAGGTKTIEIDLAPGTHASKAVAKVFSALEVACMDLQARHLQMPLHQLLGGAVRREVPFSAYLFFKFAEHFETPYPPDNWGEVLTAEQLLGQAQRMIDDYGFKSIKLKAGALEPDYEVQCLKALKKAFPGHPLRIDPNANWTLETSIRLADQLREDLEYYEDPTPGLEGMARLHAATGLPLATNMVVTDWDEFRRNIAHASAQGHAQGGASPASAVQIILSDHHYWGGLRATQLLARMCQTFGLGLSMHSNSHLGISLMAMTHLSATVSQLSYACDTHYPWQEEEVIKGGKIAIRNGCVTVTDEPGLGLEIDPAALARLHAQYLACGTRDRDDAAEMRKHRPDWVKKKPRY